MFEDTAQVDSELFATDNSEAVTNDAEAIGNDELSKETELKRNQVRQQTIKKFQDRINNGEITVEDIPPAQKWVIEALKNKETVKAKPQARIDSEDLEKLLSQREDKKVFESLKAKMGSTKLSDAEKRAVSHEYEELRADGGMMGKSLERALKLAGVRLEKDNAIDLKKAQRMPAQSTEPLDETSEFDKAFDAEGNYNANLPEDKRIKLLEAERSRGLGNATGAKAYQRYKRG